MILVRIRPPKNLRLAESRDQIQHMKEYQPRLYRWRVGFGLFFVAICFALGLLLFKNHEAVTRLVDEAGDWSEIAFIIGLSLAVVLLMPTPLIKTFAGAIFPFHIAVIVNFAGSMVGGLIAFIFGRWLFRDAILATIENDAKLKRIDAAIGEESMRISILVRLSPIIPDEWLNYILAAGPVKMRTFLISNCASLVFSLVYAYYGWAIGEVALQEGGFDAFSHSAGGLAMLVGGLIATVVATVIVTRVTMKSLSGVMAEENGEEE